MAQIFADYDALYESKLNALKLEREKLFKKLDAEFFKELETSGNVNSERARNIVRIKNELRNFPDEMSKEEFLSRDQIINYTPSVFNETF